MVTGYPVELRIVDRMLTVVVGLCHRSAAYGGVMPIWIEDSHVEV